MHIGFDAIALLLAVEAGIAVAVAILLWQLRRERAVAQPPPTVAPNIPSAPPPPPLQPAPAETRTTGKRPAQTPETDDDLEIEDGRTVQPTPLTLVWLRAGAPPERYGVMVDSVSRDGLVFGGMARRLDVIQIVPARRLFHTMLLPQERLLAIHDAQDNPIDNVRGWLLGLPE